MKHASLFRERNRFGANALLSAALACGAVTSTACAAGGPESSEGRGAGSLPGSDEAPMPSVPDFAGLECGTHNAVPSQGRLLTRRQYDNSVRDLFRGLVSGRFTAEFPPENVVAGFETNAEFHRASAWLAEAQQRAAETISARATERLGELIPCSTQLADEACALEFIRDFGGRAFRRPLTEAEFTPFVELFRSAYSDHPTQGFERGVRLVLQAVLQAPQFLYRLETDRSRVVPSGFRVAGYEAASRLSYFLWNSVPDDALRQAAADGELETGAQLEAAARRMLDDPRALDTISDFHRQWLGLDRLGSALRALPAGEPTTGQPSVEVAYGPDWHASLDLFFRDIFSLGGDVQELFGSNTVFVNPRLAPLYGAAIPPGLQDYEFVPAELDPGQRAGLLTQPGLMALLAHADQSAPIQRGVFVRTELLCQPPPPPPPSVDPTPPDPDPNATTRERFAQHTEARECAGCHLLIDPIGLGFEYYDHLGRYREHENGLPVDASGAVVATREVEIQGPFVGGVELGRRLAESEQVKDCLVAQWYRYGSGRIEEPADLCSMAQARARFTDSGGDLKELLLGLVLSDAFSYRREEEVSP